MRLSIIAIVVAIAWLPRPLRAQPAACVNPTGRTSTNVVKIDSAPQGAAIYINDKACQPIGTTPWSGKLPKGDYTVILEATGYEPATRAFKVINTRSQNQDLFVPLIKKAEPPKIDVRADADKNVFGAVIWLDGQALGPAPQVLTTTKGRHQLELHKDGFDVLSEWVEVTENQVLTVAPVLHEIAKPKYGSIVVDADVADAEVYLDNNKNPDNTPAVIQNVIEGIHVIEVRKPPGLPWKQTVEVKANEQKKVHAELAALQNGGTGVIRVISDTPGARAFIDGTDMGPVPLDIKDVKAGPHVIQVKAPGFKQESRDVVVAAGGSQIVNVTLNPDAPTDTGKIKVISSEPGAEVIVDGKSEGPAPIDKSYSAGDHIVLVQKDGFKKFEQKVRVEAGQSFSVSAELKAVGRLRVLSNPAQATVLINGNPAGKTPLELELETGETVVRLELPGFKPIEQMVTVESGKTAPMSFDLAVAGPSEMEMAAEQRGLTSIGARTLPRGRSTVDLDVGYPYYVNAKITVGAGRIAGRLGWDANIAARTMLARSELGIGGRLMFANAAPFTAAGFTEIYYGSKLLDDSGRNGVTWDAGVLASLSAFTHVTITGRAYLEVYSDRLCPSLSTNPMDKNGFTASDPLQICIDYRNYVVSGQDFSSRMAVESLTGLSGDAFFGRDTGARMMLSIAAEIATSQNWNIYFIIDGAPFQGQRALFTNLFSRSMLDSDEDLYGRVGVTYKF
jgi:hypothetical protein